MMETSTNTIRTYMQYALPLDPQKVRTLVDLDLSYALGTPLVVWHPEKEIISGLAKSWEIKKQNKLVFSLDEKAKWSDGNRITSQQVLKSFDRAKNQHGSALKSLFDLVEKIEAPDDSTVVFISKQPISETGLVRKLSEPMYGIVDILKDGSINLKRTSGAFHLSSSGEEEIKLSKSNYWKFNVKGMANAVVVRRPNGKGESLLEMKSNSWANLMSSSSLLPSSIKNELEREDFSIWNRNLDKVMFLSLSHKKINRDGLALMKSLGQALDRNAMMGGLSGFTLANQFFPSGYVLYDQEFSVAKSQTAESNLKGKRLKILTGKTKLIEQLQEGLSLAIEKVTGVKPVFEIVTMDQFEQKRAEGHYDLLMGALPVNDPNVEGAMNFFFGLTPSIIPNADQKDGNFSKRYTEARSLPTQAERNKAYRSLFSEATSKGTILPLFHFSSLVVAKGGIDLSGVPTTDETVSFSKVRFVQ